MASLNKVQLIGNLGADPETRYLPNGDAVCNIRLATTESWKDKNSGEKKESTEWHRVVFFRKLAEIAGQYLKKGASVYIEGSIKTRKWQDKDGKDQYTTEIQADEMLMLGGKQSGGTAPSQHQQDKSNGYQPQGGSPKKHGGGFDDMSDDIPF